MPLPTNPYAPPQQLPPVVAANPGTLVLATYGQRLVGALVDGLLATALGLAPAVGLHLAGLDPFTLAERARVLEWQPSTILGLLVGLVPNAIQWALIASRGQTVGKIVAKTRIITLDGHVAGFVNGVLLRQMPIVGVHTVSSLVSAYAPPAQQLLARGVSLFLSVLITGDILFIFGTRRRCLHDYIAGTEVVTTEP